MNSSQMHSNRGLRCSNSKNSRSNNRESQECSLRVPESILTNKNNHLHLSLSQVWGQGLQPFLVGMAIQYTLSSLESELIKAISLATPLAIPKHPNFFSWDVVDSQPKPSLLKINHSNLPILKALRACLTISWEASKNYSLAISSSEWTTSLKVSHLICLWLTTTATFKREMISMRLLDAWVNKKQQLMLVKSVPSKNLYRSCLL